MLRAADGGGGAGGGRPPVNIEVNFVTGGGKSAFDIEREKAAALKADLAEINGLMGGMGRGGVGGGGTSGGVGGVTTGGGSRGARPAVLPSTGFNPAARTPAEQASGEMYGPPRPWQGPTAASAGGPYAIGAASPVPAWSSGLPAGHPARRDYGSEAYGPQDHYRSARMMTADVARRNAEAADGQRRRAATAAQMAQLEAVEVARASNRARLDASFAAIDASMAAADRDWDRKVATAGRIGRISNLVGSGIGGAAIGMGTGSPLLGLGVGGALSGLGSVGAIGGLLLGGLAANTTQGTDRIRGAAGWLAQQTAGAANGQPAGFLNQMNSNLGNVPLRLMQAGGRSNILGLIQDEREAARSAARLTRSEGRQEGRVVRRDLTDAANLGSVGIGLTGTTNAVAQHAAEYNQLNSRLDLASISPESRYQTLARMQELNKMRPGLEQAMGEEQLAPKRKELELSQQMLDLRMQERNAVEAMTNRRVDSLAQDTPGNLRQLNKALLDFTDGKSGGNKRNAELLNARGLAPELPELREYNRQYLEKNAPDLAAFINKPLQNIQGSTDQLTEELATLATALDALVTTIKTGVKDMSKSTQKADGEIKAEMDAASIDIENNAVTRGRVLTNQPLYAPMGPIGP